MSEPEPNLDTVGPETECQHQARLVEPRAEASLVSDGNPGRATATVLVVEDEGPVRELILDVLRLQGYQVLEAPSGEEALAVAERHGGPIHLIVLDVVLPGMTAPDILRQLRASRPALRALYISGYTGDQIGQHGLMQVGRDFLQKPFSVDALVLKVREALDGG